MKVLVAHPAQQHSYRLAAALKKAGMLYGYATTVYCKKGSLTKAAAKLLRGNFRVKATGRRCPELEDCEVIQFCEGEGLLKLLALNTPILKSKYYKIKYNTADRFAVKVADYALKHGVDAVVTYDNTSPLLFEILSEKAPQIMRITDTSAANPLYMKQIYEKDFALAPAFENRLRRERALVWDREISDRTSREMKLTQHFLVPSEFVASSLRYSGIDDSRMHICPYGVDTDEFSLKSYDSISDDRPLKFIYVGGVKELKGISYLLEAFKQIPRDSARLIIVGDADSGSEDLRQYSDCAEFTGRVLHSDIPALLRDADVFVFPSLGEGLSLSVLEAAACGLPLIVSENSGVKENITDAVEGFVIPIQSAEAIRQKVLWFIRNRDKIGEMGKAAAEFARRYTWDAYNRNIAEIFAQLEKTGDRRNYGQNS